MFSIELGTRLFAVSDAKYKLALYSYLMPQQARDCITNIAAPELQATSTDPAILLTDPNCAAFLNTLSTTASLNNLSNDNRLRWILFDLTVFYHIVVASYVIASTDATNIEIFTVVFSHSYIHYFLLMLMFSTTESMYQMYNGDIISEHIPVPASYAYNCLRKWSDKSTNNITAIQYTRKHYIKFLAIQTAKERNVKSPYPM